MAPSGLGGDDSPEVRWKQPVEQAKMLLFGAGPQGDSRILLYRSADIKGEQGTLGDWRTDKILCVWCGGGVY